MVRHRQLGAFIVARVPDSGRDDLDRLAFLAAADFFDMFVFLDIDDVDELDRGPAHRQVGEILATRLVPGPAMALPAS